MTSKQTSNLSPINFTCDRLMSVKFNLQMCTLIAKQTSNLTLRCLAEFGLLVINVESFSSCLFWVSDPCKISGFQVPSKLVVRGFGSPQNLFLSLIKNKNKI